jgi:hypothetical protein
LDGAFVYAGFYSTNWINFQPLAGPARNKQGSIVIKLPWRADVALPVIDMDADFGKFVAPAFLDPKKFHYKDLLAAAEYITVSQMAAAYTEVTGERIKIIPIPFENLPIDELQVTAQLFSEYGYYVGEQLEPTHELYGPDFKLNTFKDWLRDSGYKVPAAH